MNKILVTEWGDFKLKDMLRYMLETTFERQGVLDPFGVAGELAAISSSNK